jgi:hypothetical protein
MAADSAVFSTEGKQMERDELHELIMLLKEELEAGRAKLSSKHTLAALGRVRFAEAGKVDPGTVDGSVRAFALAVAASKAQREMKQASLRDVQSKYFDILDDNFGMPFSEMKRHGLTPQQVAEGIASNEAMVKAFSADLPNLTAGLRNFWESFGPVVEAHLGDLGCLKSVFGGDVFPSYTSNIACSVGLYMDTVVLPDPLLRLLTLANTMRRKDLLLYVIKHALNALGYRDLALADVQPPIVVIAPDHWGLDETYGMAMKIAGEADALVHASRMFGRGFATVPDLIDFLKQFTDANQIVARIVDPTRLLFNSEWSGTLPEQIERYAKETLPVMQLSAGAGEAVYYSISGRMIMTNEVLLRGSRYGGSPLIDAPTSWQYLQWKYEYDSHDRGDASTEKRDVLISKALGSRMLAGIPPGTLIELRRNGASAELREVVGKGIEQINSASDAALSTVAEAVIANVDNAFSEHDQQLRALSSSHNKFYGFDVGRYVINSGFLIASALVHSTALGVLAAISQMAGTPSPIELQRRYRELRTRAEYLRRSPVGTMFRHLKHKFGFSSQ